MSAHDNAHYQDVNHGWPEVMPACTRQEADRASRAIVRHFKMGLAGPLRVRRCWIAVTPPYDKLNRGWRRLVHDWSHRLFRVRNRQHAATRNRRPHDPSHVRVEREVMQFVLERGFLNGRLAPTVKPKVRTTDADKVARIAAAQKRWTTKLRRAETALRKLKKQAAYYAKKTAAQTA
jgi:hypothetical protein